ncbi:MAG: MBOAT family O-acyltransferase, partial [Bacteroidia bacterium]|nr:MBOAT family O-acyltransferase [Bacteroidia bacterium]
TAWLAVFCYTFQIYADFSAYSDMAIGLAKMFGFQFPENFNFPYLAKSFKDFWTRWHISLSTWFRDYLYIPLGGNRKGPGRIFLNLWIVFLCTGFWHGASWNFLIWGAFHGFFLSLEKLVPFRKLKIPAVISRCTMFFLIMLSWVPFRAVDLGHTLNMYKKMFGFSPTPEGTYHLYMQSTLLTRDFYLILLISLFCAFGGIQFIRERKHLFLRKSLAKTIDLVKLAALVLIFALCSIYIVSGSYSPFIYFRF